jgi:potassium efflux system protein
MHDLPPNWIQTGLAVLVGGVFLSWLVQWLARSLNEGKHAWSRAVRQRMGVLPERRIGELRWVALTIQLALWPLLGYVLLRLWNLEELGHDFIDKLLDTGIKVGKTTTIVPGKVLLGLMLFLLLVTFTRWFKRKLERDWLPMTQMEPSVRMSVATLYGYITFVIALLVGLSFAGLDLSKIALVAGALSVGIGFGLQNIVNNFVSGLILLFERPVRVGDFIKVGTTEGYVRQIRIRSTELENDDRISVIVPNSALLGAEVQNWNYRNSLGRAVVGINLAHGSDADAVRAMMLEVANAHPQVFKTGERGDIGGPWVVLKEITESSLRFELGASVRNIHSRGTVASDIRFELLRRIAAADPAIKFPQSSVWIHDADKASAEPRVEALPPAANSSTEEAAKSR